MVLGIDFYSKDKVSISLDFSGQNPFTEDATNELYIFTCFTLRQFSNLGNHPVAFVLAALLTKYDQETTIKLVQGNYEFPTPSELRLLLLNNGVNIGIDYGILKNQIMPGLPSLVEYQGKGKKVFIVTLQPFNLKHKGFGLLGLQVNYYAFHSVIALYTYLAKNRIDNNLYLDQLSQVAKYCGKIQISSGVPLGDQSKLANNILKELSITTQ